MNSKNSTARVLVTGAGGAIGIHMIAHILLNTDWHIVATDSFQKKHKGDYRRIKEILISYPEHKDRLTIITKDLNEPFTKAERKALGKIDYIINLASISDVGVSIESPIFTVQNNTNLMLTMLELARDLKPKTFLHFSTDEVYGSADKDSHGHKEWSAIVPSNPYSASKASQEALAIAWWRSYGVPVVITNTMNNFGETQGKTKFPALIQQKIENGEEIKVHVSSDGQIGTRYYIHSRNVADAVLFLLKKEPYMHKSGEVDKPDRYNIVGDKQVSNLELVELISKLMVKEAKYTLENFHGTNPGHDLHYGLDGTKLTELGWTSPVSFEDSLKKTIEWQKDHPEWL